VSGEERKEREETGKKVKRKESIFWMTIIPFFFFFFLCVCVFVCVYMNVHAVMGRGDAADAGRNPTKQKKSVRKSTHLHMQAAFPICPTVEREPRYSRKLDQYIAYVEVVMSRESLCCWCQYIIMRDETDRATEREKP
jgi:hypothetical protein